MSEPEPFLARADLEYGRRMYAQALPLYEAAARSAREPEQQVQAWFRAGLCARALGQPAVAEERLQRAAAEAEGHALNARAANALGVLGLLASEAGRPAQAEELHRRALRLAERSDDTRAMATQLGNLGLLALARGDNDEARQRLSGCLAAYVALGDAANAANALNCLGELERGLGHRQAAGQAFGEALRLWRDAGSPEGQALALANLGELARAEGRLEAAEWSSGESLELARAARDTRGEARALTNLANLAAIRGQRESARQRHQAALALHERIGGVEGATAERLNLAILEVDAGRLAEARATCAEAVAAFERVGSARRALEAGRLGAQLDARLGFLDDAEGALRAARARAEELGAQELVLHVDIDLAALAFARGHVEAAREGLLAGAEGLRERRLRPEEIACLLAAADAQIAAGELDGATATATEALRLADEVGADRYRLDARGLLASLACLRGGEDDDQAELLAIAASTEAAGRPLDALGYRLAAADDAPGALTEPAVAAPIERAAATAASPLARIEAESLLLATGPAQDESLARLRTLASRADALGVGLLAVRVRRRLAGALARSGRQEEAERVRRAALAQANELGAVLEARRLEATSQAR